MLGEAENFDSSQAGGYYSLITKPAQDAADAALAQQIATSLAQAFVYTAPTPVPVADPRARIVQQLRMINKLIKRSFASVPSEDQALYDWLASTLVGKGTTNLMDIAAYDNPALPLAFWYDRRTGAVLAMNRYGGAPAVKDNGFATLTRDRTNYTFVLQFTPDGFPLFVAIARDLGSDWVDIRGGLIFVGSIVLAAVGAPYVSQLGSAVVGPTVTAQYPALAQGVGQAMVSTALNGGDVRDGVTSAFASYVGAGVGQGVTSATNADIVGKAAAAATRALINGGDIDAAVLQSLAQSGVSSMQSLLLSGASGDDDFIAMSDDIDYTDDFNATGADFGISSADLSAIGDLQMGQYYTDENGVTYGVDADGDLAVVDYIDDQGIGYATDAQGDLMVVDSPTSSDLSQQTATDANGTAPITAGANSAGANVLSSLATAALALVTSYVKAGAPQIRTGTASATVNPNGTITTRNPNGTLTTTRPAAGTPYLSASGSLVTNNGDGTYTTVLPSGQITTRSYAVASAAGSVPPAMLYAGAAVVAALLLSRR